MNSISSNDKPDDVRMRGFARRTPLWQAIRWLDDQLNPLRAEEVPLKGAFGRVLTETVTSHYNVPGFARAMMDGYAVVATDTLGASTYNRLRLKVVGQSLPGTPTEATVTTGRAIRIMTGAAMPAGADAVLPVEDVLVDETGILVSADVAPGKHVAVPGEDIAQGTEVLPAGRSVRPQDIGVLASIGVSYVKVIRRPRVRIVVTGNELLPPGSQPVGTRIVDSNSPMLDALITRDGGLAQNPGIVPDRPEAIRQAMHDDVDVILVSGGSSVGEEDYAPQILRQDGQLAIHGIAMRPSSPTGLGRLGDRFVILLPGNPVSCLCAYDFFAGRVIRCLGGRAAQWPYRCETRKLARKLTSVVGRVDYARVRFAKDLVQPMAVGGASILSSATRADGFVVVPEDSEGYAEGSEIEVFLYGPE
jgi:molybdopterin molybdotransferase